MIPVDDVPASTTARRIVAWIVVSQVLVSMMLLGTAVVIHNGDPSTADALLVGIMAFWLGHGSALGQYAALSVARPIAPPPCEGNK